MRNAIRVISFTLLFMVVTAPMEAFAWPIFGGRGLPGPKAGEIEGLFDSERGPYATYQILDVPSGMKHAIDSLVAGDHREAMNWVHETRRYATENKIAIPIELDAIEKLAVSEEVRRLVDEGNLAVRQGSFKRASAYSTQAFDLVKALTMLVSQKPQLLDRHIKGLAEAVGLLQAKIDSRKNGLDLRYRESEGLPASKPSWT